MGDLKPCPFCGGQAEVKRPGSARQSNIVECSDCGCRLESSDQMPGYDLSWDCRPIEDDLRAEVAKLTAGLERWKAPLTVDQIASVCAIADTDWTPGVDTRINSLDTVIRVVRVAGEQL